MVAGLLLALGVLALILIPIAPKLVRLRIRFFRWIHWNWAANLLETYFQRWVVFFRVVLSLIGLALLFAGWRGSL